VKADGGYLMNGSKIFTTNGTVADFITVVATVDPAAGTRGLELFLVDTTRGPASRSGASSTSSRYAARIRRSCSSRICSSPTSHCLGDGKGGGFLKAYKSLTVDRIFTAALALGNAQCRLRCRPELRAASAASSVSRSASSRRFSSGWWTCWRKLEQARLYTYHVSALADRGASITTEAALAKITAAESGNEICHQALAIFGGYGLMNEYPAQRFLRDSHFPMIGGGTGDIMRLIVARQLGF
jgi:alkylation response protein AidB-like acyl-CoA dehydrogenase